MKVKRNFFQIYIMFTLLIFSGALCAAAQIQTPTTASPTPGSQVPAHVAGQQIHLPDSAVILLEFVGIFLLGGVLSRIFRQLRFIHSQIAILLIFFVVACLNRVFIAFFFTPDSSPCRFAQLVSLFLLFLIILLVIVRLVFPSQRSRTRASLPILVRNLTVFVLALIVFFLLLLYLFPEINLTPVFLTSGVLSIVIGLAVQDILSNLLAGLVLSFDRPFKVNDWVHLDDVEGEVIRITWRTTRIRNFENDIIELPNSRISKAKIVNHCAPTTIHMRKLYVGVTYETPPGIARKALLEAAVRVNGVRTKPAPAVHFRKYEDSSLLFELRVWLDNYALYPVIESELHKEVWYAFKRHNITIPFPIRDINFKKITEIPTKQIARLIACTDPWKGSIFELSESKNTIGRTPDNSITLKDPQVSKNHAVVFFNGKDFILRDQKSRHGTWLNGKKISESRLQQGDEITIGPVKFIFEMNSVPVDTQ